MVFVNALLLVTTGLLVNTQAYSFSADPVLVRSSQNGITILDQGNMAYGAPIPPQEYSLTDAQGNTLTFNSTEEISKATIAAKTPATRLESAYTFEENWDLYYLENAFNTHFVRNADEINNNWKEGSPSKTAWPGSYWPVFADGINYRWDNGAPSPAEKYAQATGIDVASFMDGISARSGIDSQSAYTPCTSNEQCNEGSACGIRPGREWGHCIVTWAGICHAWGPAAIFEDEPRCPVTINDVTFQPMDIKALITQFYDGAHTPTVGAGLRFNGYGDFKDEFGRFIDYAQRDISPAILHIALANIIGRLDQNFVVDVSPSYTVWNHPIRSYAFSDPYVMNPDEAANYFFGAPSYEYFNPDAVSVHYVQNTFQYIRIAIEDGAFSDPSLIDYYTTTVTYEYLLELDAENNIIGGEWVNESRDVHPDFLYVPLSKPDANMVTDVGINYGFMSDLIQQSANGYC